MSNKEIWDVTDPQFKNVLLDNVSPFCCQYDKIQLLATTKKWKSLVSNKRFWKGKLIINNTNNITDVLTWLVKMGQTLSNITELTTNIISYNTQSDKIYDQILLVATITTIEAVATHSTLYLIQKCADKLTNLTLHIRFDIDYLKKNLFKYSQGALTIQLMKFLDDSLATAHPKLTNFTITNHKQKLDRYNDHNAMNYHGGYYNAMNSVSKICDKIEIKKNYPSLKHFHLQSSEKQNNLLKYDINKIYSNCEHLESLTIDYFRIRIFWTQNELKTVRIKDLTIYDNLLKNKIFSDIMKLPTNDKNQIPNLNIYCNSFITMMRLNNYNIHLFSQTKKMTIICNCRTHLVKHRDILEELPRIRETNPDMKIEFLIKNPRGKAENLYNIPCGDLDKYININELDPSHISTNKHRHMAIACTIQNYHTCVNSYSVVINKTRCAMCNHAQDCTSCIVEFMKKYNTFASYTIQVGRDTELTTYRDMSKILEVAKMMNYIVKYNGPCLNIFKEELSINNIFCL